MQRKLLNIVAIMALIAACSCSKRPEVVLATVDGTEITTSDLIARMNMERGKYDPLLLQEKMVFQKFRQQALNNLIQETMLLNEANRLGLAMTDAEVAASSAASDPIGQEHAKQQGVDHERWRETQRRRALIRKLIYTQVTSRIPISDREIAAYYRQHIQEFRRPAQFRARQIVVDSLEEAENILARLKRGEDFAELARSHSASPDGKKGGDLGYFDARSHPKIFAEVCQQLKLGETSDVVTSDYGYHIFQLLDQRPARTRSLEEATPLIRERLQEEKSKEPLQEWFAKLKKKAAVSINELTLKEATLEPKG
jgi:parvulin-like peptidyl-prolyl isomerase